MNGQIEGLGTIQSGTSVDANYQGRTFVVNQDTLSITEFRPGALSHFPEGEVPESHETMESISDH